MPKLSHYRFIRICPDHGYHPKSMEDLGRWPLDGPEETDGKPSS